MAPLTRKKPSVVEMVFAAANSKSSSVGSNGGSGELEIRPGGMLVQMRGSDSNQCSAPTPTIKIRVKHGSSNHEIRISPHASFGELKKLLAQPTRLHPEEQKLMFKNKERSSRTYLDVAGVKEGSKVVLIEDILSRERRCLEMLRNAKFEKAAKSLTDMSSEVEELAKQVTSLNGRGGEVSEEEVENLTELLMTKLIQLDGIVAEGELKLQRRSQVRKVQKNIETLDLLKLHLSRQSADVVPVKQQEHATWSVSMSKDEEKQRERRHSESVVVTTKWETFD